MVIVGPAQPVTWDIARADYRYSVAYLRAISLTCSRVSCFGGTTGGLQVSRTKPSKPAGHDPEQKEFVIGIGEPMPSISGNEYRSTLLDGWSCIVQCENSAAFNNVEG